MQIVTSWMREGLEQGRQEGLEEGRRQEALAIVLRLLARRVGVVEPQLQEHIQELAIAQIEDLGEALLDFTSKADLVAWLGEREASSD